MFVSIYEGKLWEFAYSQEKRKKVILCSYIRNKLKTYDEKELIKFYMELLNMLAQTDWGKIIVEPFRQIWYKVTDYLPLLISALIILIVGWIVARLIKLLVDWILKTARFDKLADRTGISAGLKKGDLKITARELISRLIFWLIMIMVIIMTVDALGIPRAYDVLIGVFDYIPKVIAALLVLVVALFLANFVSGKVGAAASNAYLPGPEIFAAISRWAIIIFAAAIAMVELGIAPLLVTITFNIILGGFVLALALAFGLGGKDAASKYLEELKEKRNQRKTYR